MKPYQLPIVLALMQGMLVCGCGGGVEVQQHEDALRLLDLAPRTGETVAEPAPDVVAVFSVAVRVDAGEAHLNGETFFVEDDQGARPAAGIEESALDDQGATAVLRFSQDLEAGRSYTIVIRETVKGRREEGGVVGLTEPLGVEIRSFFTVAAAD